jgi:hypothetical protein
MGDIEDLGSAFLVKVQDTKNYKSRSFTILGNNLGNVVDFTNIMKI